MSAIEIKRRQWERRRKRRERRIWAVCLIVCVVIIALLLCGSARNAVPVRYEYHTCDVLWDFVKFCPERMDRWEYLDEIMELNDMDDYTVYPNKLYKVPIYK